MLGITPGYYNLWAWSLAMYFHRNQKEYMQSNPMNTDNEWAMDSVGINRVSILSWLNLEKQVLRKGPL